MKTLVIVALLVAITIPPSTTSYLDQSIYQLTYCSRSVRHVSHLRRMPECCLNRYTMMSVPGAAQYCCANYKICTGLDEPFLLWPQSSADTFPILKEDSDEMTIVNSTEFSDVDKFLNKATFIFRTGLCGESSTVSIESQLYPGKFWRHQNSIIKLHSKEETNLFKEDSCFKISQGDCNNGSFTLESVNYPGYFIQKCGSQMKIRTDAENCGTVSNKCWVNPVSQQASLAYCSTIVTDVLDVPLHPECCNHDATMEEFGGCCLELMNDNNDGCYETPASNPYQPMTAPVSNTNKHTYIHIYKLLYCRTQIRKWQDIATFPECCLYRGSRMVKGVTEHCCDLYGICLGRIRKKRQIQGCPTNCRDINYCVRKMKSTTNWYEPLPECCCHPFRKNVMMKRKHLHPKLYNEECKELGHPDVRG